MARDTLTYDEHEIREAFAKAIGADPCDVTSHITREPLAFTMSVDLGPARPKRVYDMHADMVLAELSDDEFDTRFTGASQGLTCPQISGRTGIEIGCVLAAVAKLKEDGRVKSAGRLDASGHEVWWSTS